MTTRYVAPAGGGTQDGSSWANAAPFTSLQALHDAMAHGDTIYLLAGAKYTAPTLPLQWSKRIAVRGRTQGGLDAYALIEGVRSNPWPANGTWTDSGRYTAANAGQDFLQYKDGAAASGGTAFAWLAFRNTGIAFRPLFDSAAVTGAITVDHIKTFNTAGLVYVVASTDGQCSITGTHCRSFGYSRGMFRAFGSMFLTDCHGDGRNQFKDPSTNLFGAHVQDAIAGVTAVKYDAQFVRCSFINHAAAAPAGSSQDPATTSHYPQGDGIVVEENTNLLPSSDIYVTGNADRGIDIKCVVPEGYLTRVYAEGNNYDIGVHDDTVLTVITDSWLGSTYSPPYRPDKSACVQGSGHLLAKRCYLNQGTPDVSQPAGKFFIAMATGQASHVQSGVTIPDRVGNLTAQDCVRHQGAGVGLANLASIGFGTPTYTESNVAAV